MTDRTKGSEPQSAEAASYSLALACLKLLLFLLLLSASLSYIILLWGDNALYGGKIQFLAWHLCISAYSLAAVLDAGFLLETRRRRTSKAARRTVLGVAKDLCLPVASPWRLPPLLGAAAAMGMMFTLLSFLTVIL
jgi:hypothetical protein